jgi:hypothetical protein
MKTLTYLITVLVCMSTLSAIADEKQGSTKKIEKIVVGKRAPDFTATGIDGKPFKLSEKLKSGKKNIAVMFSRANW